MRLLFADSFRRQPGLFHITLDARRRVFITPVVFSIGGYLNAMSESRNTAVYTALRRVLRGPGLCAACKYDLRESALPCPECGGDKVSPVN
jgi:hypothetical protein